MPDYEDMILQRQEAWEASQDCGGDCRCCPHSDYCEEQWRYEDER